MAMDVGPIRFGAKKARLLLLSKEVDDPGDLAPFLPSAEAFTHYVVIGYETDERDEAIMKLQQAALSLQDLVYGVDEASG